MKEIDEGVVRQKVQRLMKDMGVSKKKLGEVLGSRGDHVNVRINRANRFLSGAKKKLTLQEVNKISTFFGKSPNWFFHPGDKEGLEALSNSENPEEAIVVIETQLRSLGFPEEYIEVQVDQLRAVIVQKKEKAKK